MFAPQHERRYVRGSTGHVRVCNQPAQRRLPRTRFYLHALLYVTLEHFGRQRLESRAPLKVVSELVRYGGVEILEIFVEFDQPGISGRSYRATDQHDARYKIGPETRDTMRHDRAQR